MTIKTEDLLNSILDSLDRITYIKAEDIPNIDLYMDQVTTFMESRLKRTTRNPGEDKILTKTMINNYAKNDLLPPPFKKKYSREHVMLLVFIYYYKGILSINDIQELLEPITRQFFGSKDAFNLETIYETAFGLEQGQIDALKKDITEKFQTAKGTFLDAPEESQEFLQVFSFICMLGFDVYLKKLLIEKMIDSFHDDRRRDLRAKEPKAREAKEPKALEKAGSAKEAEKQKMQDTGDRQPAFFYNRKLPQQKPFQGRMRSILVIAAAERRFFIVRNCCN